jgi:GrpB-like predicted nucleotidyltransferase (UPF0157 family)
MSWTRWIILFLVAVLLAIGVWRVALHLGHQRRATYHACSYIDETFNRENATPGITQDQQAADVRVLLQEALRATPELQNALVKMENALQSGDGTLFDQASTDIVNACTAAGR